MSDVACRVVVPRWLFGITAAIVRRVPNRPKKFRSVLAFAMARAESHGRLRVSVSGVRFDLELSDWFQRLYALGATDETPRRLLARFIPVGGTFIDVGANIGLYTCTIARHVGPAGRVIAFEPLPANLAMLQANVALNGLMNTDVRALALSDSGGMLELFAPPGHPGGGSANVSAKHGDDHVPLGKVEVVRLDDVFDQDSLDAMKLDVLGHELKVLDGAHDTLRRHRPVLLCEVNQPEVFTGMLEFAESMHYSVMVERKGELHPFDGTESPNDLFFVPVERSLPHDAGSS